MDPIYPRDFPASNYEQLLRLTQSEAIQADGHQFVEKFLSSPQFNQLQIFSNQALRILDASSLKYLYVSDSMVELTGYGINEIVNGGLLFMYRHTHVMDVIKLTTATIKVRKVLKGLTADERMRARFSYDLRFTCKGGEVKRILQNCHVLKLDENFDPHILLFASTDITPYKLDTKMHYSLSVHESGKGFTTIFKDSITEANCPLSSRELQILAHTSEGLSEKEIANQLHLSVETVKTHRRNMLQKTNTRNAIELVRLAFVNGWI